jgi:hypothetical protein
MVEEASRRAIIANHLNILVHLLLTPRSSSGISANWPFLRLENNPLADKP